MGVGDQELDALGLVQTAWLKTKTKMLPRAMKAPSAKECERNEIDECGDTSHNKLQPGNLVFCSKLRESVNHMGLQCTKQNCAWSAKFTAHEICNKPKDGKLCTSQCHQTVCLIARQAQWLTNG